MSRPKKPEKVSSFVYQRIRPRKVAFIIREGDLPSLQKAIKINSLGWGGIHNILLITSNAPKLTNYQQELLKLSDPDALYVISKEDSPLVDELDYYAKEVSLLPNRTFAHNSPIGILINAIIEKLVRSSKDKPSMIIPTVSESSPLYLSYLLKYGILPDNKEEQKLLYEFETSPSSNLKNLFDIVPITPTDEINVYVNSIIERLEKIDKERIYDLPSLTKLKTHWSDTFMHFFEDEDFHEPKTYREKSGEI